MLALLLALYLLLRGYSRIYREYEDRSEIFASYLYDIYIKDKKGEEDEKVKR